MLSILIPIYNEDVTRLVKELSYQCNKLKISYEIICFDDGSKESIKAKNEVLRSVFRVNYVELSENVGRAKIRNLLARTARYEHLLFLDGDTRLLNRSFVKNYVQHLPSPHVIVGGRVYSKKPPKAQSKLLHWTYGTQRESLPAIKRQKAGYMHFHSNNFIIPSHIAKEFPFDESIQGYGYEDLVYAYDIEQAGHRIWHIDNPTRHGQIEKTDRFLEKTLHSLANLKTLHLTGRLPETRLTRSYHKLKSWRLLGLIERYLTRKSEAYLSNLKGSKPNMRQFNLWKLWHFIKLMKQN